VIDVALDVSDLGDLAFAQITLGEKNDAAGD
jgi:hypothetical protein